MPHSHAERRGRLRTALEHGRADAVLVTRLVNVRYLTGFTGSNAALLLTPKSSMLATDGRYRTQARDQAPDVDHVIDRAVAEVLTARAAAAGVRRLAFEEHDVTVALHDTLTAALGSGRGSPELVRLGGAVERLRAVKDDGELALLREACAVSDRALRDLLPSITPGRTERSIARELENRLLDHGGDGPAFETIVATGPHSAVPHHRPTGRAVAAGDFLKIDFGARFRGYHADCTRTFVVGAEPRPWQVDVHALVFAAQRAGREALTPGAAARDVDRAARSVIEDGGHGEHFPHGLGHGVGLEIHEAPLLAAASTARLADRTPLTVEPGVYLEGRGGVRIEDTLVVRDAAAGGPELLTMTTKELLVLG
jgi:Xaa-Pro aminopeptidase